ncbi:lactonohydrolase [Colletotrichum costaricense]|uniref:Lactonohydrolase n=1 Tax=Colletotrichum costaricense TaxID=1209916 RepID=A0AAI9YYA9_9PEZI|nr:lactonohydrolase [Colletotrichum costaricense]KAK1528699.1 lactonohydrolase [Colletotrichum costaricense]
MLAQDTSIVSVPYELPYLLPSPFHGNLFYSFVNGTNTSDALTNELLQSATKAPFISYDDEFLALLGQNPAIELIEKRPGNFAREAGVWISDRNELWYTTWINDGPTHVEILDLKNNSIRNLTSSQSLKNPNGGFYHQGLMYFTCLRDDSRDCFKFDNIEDVAWVTQPGTNNSYMFITVLPFAGGSTTTDRLPQGLWRWDPQKKVLLPAISRTEFPVANGVRPSRDQKTLWVTDFGGDERSRIWALPAQVGAPAIYKYDLNEDMWPVNKRTFGVSRMQAPDGIRIDDKGRVWTDEGEGVVVRSSQGKLIGVFNGQFFTRDSVNTAIV